MSQLCVVGNVSEVGLSARPAVSPSARAPGVGRRLLVGGAWAFAGKSSNAFFNFFSNVLLARLLMPRDFGTFFLAQSFIVFTATCAQLGLNTTIVQLVASRLGRGDPQGARAAVRVAMLLTVGSSLLVGACLWLAFPLVSRFLFHDETLMTAGMLMAVGTGLLALGQLGAESLRGFHELRLASIFSGPFQNALFAVMILGAKLFWHLTLIPVLQLAVASYAINLLIVAICVRWTSRQAGRLPEVVSHSPPLPVWDVINQALPLLIVTLVGLLVHQLDLWTIGAVGTKTDLALYSAVTRWILIIGLPIHVLNVIITPTIAELYTQSKVGKMQDVLRIASTIAGYPAILVLVMMCFLASPLLTALYGSFYKPAAPILILLSVGELINVCTGPSLHTLMMTKHQKLAMVISIFSVPFMAVLCYVLGRAFGARGVAVGAVVTVTGLNLAYLFAAKYVLGIWCHPYVRPRQLIELAGQGLARLKQRFAIAPGAEVAPGT